MDIDQIKASANHRTILNGAEEFYVGLPSFTPGVSTDGWMTLADIFTYNPGIDTATVNTSTYTLQATDVNAFRDFVNAGTQSITVPNGLPRGTYTFSKSGAGNVVIATLGSAVVLEAPGATNSTIVPGVIHAGSRTALTTLFGTMALICISSNRYRLAGAEA